MRTALILIRVRTTVFEFFLHQYARVIERPFVASRVGVHQMIVGEIAVNRGVSVIRQPIGGGTVQKIKPVSVTE
ncbi:hypothetical protein [Pleionea sediminis]|uniref:hypothetical protein n=1 Tax=Pleionea sediminis TaxID=2569479 RepID=UPI0013DE46D1|nr:hypothetical protein [Pleionea sediminis]